MNDVTVGKRFIKTLEQHETHAVATERAVGLRIKRAAVSI
jgi:hypothetical protein